MIEQIVLWTKDNNIAAMKNITAMKKLLTDATGFRGNYSEIPAYIDKRDQTAGLGTIRE
jgi:hypothetical protein